MSETSLSTAAAAAAAGGADVLVGILSNSFETLHSDDDMRRVYTPAPSTGVAAAVELSAADLQLLREGLWECTLRPGEAIFFPSMWMHATLNLEQYNFFVSVFLDTQLIPAATEAD